jgi:hypothetical protein
METFVLPYFSYFNLRFNNCLKQKLMFKRVVHLPAVYQGIRTKAAPDERVYSHFTPRHFTLGPFLQTPHPSDSSPLILRNLIETLHPPFFILC